MSLDDDIRAIRADTAAIRQTVEWLEDTVRGTGLGGPRILPGDGGKPTQPTTPTTPVEPPPQPPTIDNSPATFPWGFVGQVRREDFGGGSTHSYSMDVPAGYDGALVGNITSVPGTPEYTQVALWFSASPGGREFPGSSYRGPTGQMGLSTPDRWIPPAGRVYFNVTASGAWGVRTMHS